MNPSLSSATAAFHQEALQTLQQIEEWTLSSIQNPSASMDQQAETFRLLHSLKGTAASFGNESIAQICHAIENVLADKTQLNTQGSKALLMAIDYCRHILSNSPLSPEQHDDQRDECIARLNMLVKQDLNSANQTQLRELYGSVWQIDFAPHAQFFENGHDPLRIIRSLRNFGPIKVSVFTEKLPEFADFDPFKCYLRWQITLKAELDYYQLAAQFEWVKHISDVTIDILALPQKKRVIEPNRYKLNEANLEALLTVSQIIQSQLQQAVALTNQLNQTDKIRLSRRNQAMKRQQQFLQQQLLHIAMCPLADAFARLPRMAFDLASKTAKPVQLNMDLAPIELDSFIVNSLIDPLTHLLRNAMAHGIEAAEHRQQQGKPLTGQIHISAEQAEDQLIIRFSDDGAGLAEDKVLAKAKQMGINIKDLSDKPNISEWIFRAGFSTSQSADAISGRGVGLDVVKQHVTDMGGDIELVSNQGRGCCFIIKIPVLRSLMDVQLIRINDQTLALPLIHLIDSYLWDNARVIWLNGKQWFITDENQQVPLIDISRFLQLPYIERNEQSAHIVLVNVDKRFFAFSVDSLADQMQLLIKSLRPHYHHINGIKGIAILPEGDLALLLEPSKLLMAYEMDGGN
ncbi:MAG: hypothetical protein E8F57_06180 [Methylophaga nitratireducenticrescens]|uniref:chemotaxis protein CheA n=1 Tax=Methylophaga sp. SB9B TaxID=2570356 RepID=UPI0010A8070B|nr:ATP-binding protein [Methylophaga sp. SB9B]THF49776.1 MAG: hypothetical protein E8F57_06180 [Methylophaga nitratireducenticrescens]THK40960.1 hypothetical protein E8Q33_10465 [Methylophaga sp. SB9B]